MGTFSSGVGGTAAAAEVEEDNEGGVAAGAVTEMIGWGAGDEEAEMSLPWY